MLVTRLYCWEAGDYIDSPSEAGPAWVEFPKFCFINPRTWDFIDYIFHKVTARVLQHASNRIFAQNRSISISIHKAHFALDLGSKDWQLKLINTQWRLGDVVIRNLKSMGVVDGPRPRYVYKFLFVILYLIRSLFRLNKTGGLGWWFGVGGKALFFD